MNYSKRVSNPIFVREKDFTLDKKSRQNLEKLTSLVEIRKNLGIEIIPEIIDFLDFPLIAKYLGEDASYKLVKLRKENDSSIAWKDIASPLDEKLSTFTPKYLKRVKQSKQVKSQIENGLYLFAQEVFLDGRISKQTKRISIKDPSLEKLSLKDSRRSAIDYVLVQKYFPKKFKEGDVVYFKDTSVAELNNNKHLAGIEGCFFVDSINSLIEVLFSRVKYSHLGSNLGNILNKLGDGYDFTGKWIYVCRAWSKRKEDPAYFVEEGDIRLYSGVFEYKGEVKRDLPKYLQYFYYVANETNPYQIYQSRGILISLSGYDLTSISAVTEGSQYNKQLNPAEKKHIPVLIKNDSNNLEDMEADGLIEPKFINAVLLSKYTLEPEKIVFIDTRCLIMEISRETMSDILQSKSIDFMQISEFLGGVICPQ